MSGTGEHLKREVGVFGLSANILNIMIGAGIFVLPAIVAAGLGSASLLAYLFCGILIALVMLCFAEVGSKVTTSGGAYTYIQTSFGPYFGFLTVILFGVSAISADAAVANAIADVASSIFPIFKTGWFRTLFFFIIFASLAYVNVIGVKEGMRVVMIITIAKLIPLVLLILFSWGQVSIDNLSIDFAPTVTDLGQVSLILFFAFQGSESGLSISGEVKNPKNTIPKAILISITGVLILYILIQTVSQGVLGESLANFKENPLSVVAEQVFGPIGFTIITIGAAISMFGNLSSEVLSIPRVLFRASKDKVLPFNVLSKVHENFSTPYISIIAYASMGFLFASIGGFEQLAIISSAAILMVYLGVSLSVIKMRTLKDTELSGFKIPGGYTVPVFSSLIIVWMLSNLSLNEIFSFGLFIIGLTLIYFIRKRMRIGLR
jgi:amino acid transporter